MQDRFKFRVYIKYAKMMCYDVNSFYIDRLKNKITIHFDDHTKTFKFDDVVLEQSTGIKDSNDDLIYEGDIVEFDGDFCGDIAWDEDAGCWAIRTTENTIYTFDNLYGYELTVIGNIHENPELLEQSNDD